jgi:hypothetical protein
MPLDAIVRELGAARGNSGGPFHCSFAPVLSVLSCTCATEDGTCVITLE